MNREERFIFGLGIVTLLFALPIMVTITVNEYVWLALFIGCYFFAIYMVYRLTIRNIRPKYPIVNPEGRPDIYSGKMPRPIYEDMQRYLWFFKKRRHAKKSVKKRRSPEGIRANRIVRISFIGQSCPVER